MFKRKFNTFHQQIKISKTKTEIQHEYQCPPSDEILEGDIFYNQNDLICT
jgi:hypothetical protein